MNRRCMILLAVAMTTVALTSSAQAYTMERAAPSSESVFVLEGDGVFHLSARFGGLVWPYIWHEAQWYWDGQLVATDTSLSGQTASTRGEFPRTSPGTHEAKVRAKYDSFPFGVHVWTSYLTWTVTIVDREAYTIERVSPVEQSCSVPMHAGQNFGARLGGIVSEANWDEARWYVNGELVKTEALSGQTDWSYYWHPKSPLGTYEVKVHAQYSLGESVWTDYLTWNAEVVPHPPSASRVSPDSPVALQAGDLQTFTARGVDPGGGTDSLEIAGVRWYLDGAEQGDFALAPGPADSTIGHTWSHMFHTGGSYEVEAVFYDDDGCSSAGGEAAWTVVVEAHDPSGMIASPSSPATVYTGVPVTFTLEGADPADDLWLCEVSLDGVLQTYASFSGAGSGSTAAWTHIFNMPGTYRVVFVPVDSADNYGTAEVWTVVVKPDPGQAGLNILVIELNAQGRAQGPLAGAKVDLTGPAAAMGATTDGQGKFALTGLEPGTYTVNVSEAGYYAQSRSVSLAAGETKDEVFRLTPESLEPSAFDFTSPRGRHLIEGMPGDLSFSAIVAWNGSPGSVCFNAGGNSYPATVTDLGGGKALAEVSIPSAGHVTQYSEVSLEAVNREGKTVILSTGVFVYALSPALREFLADHPDWTFSGGTLYSKVEGTYTFWDVTDSSTGFSLKASVGYQEQLTFDPWAGTLSRSFGGSGKVNMSVPISPAEFLGEVRVDYTKTRVLVLFGCESPTVKLSQKVSCSGKVGVGAPVVSLISVVFPPAAPAITSIQKVPVLGDVLKAYKLRLFLILGGATTVQCDELDGGCIVGTTSQSNSLTFGLEAQAVIAFKKWGWKLEAGAYVGGTGTPEFTSDWELKGLTLRGYVGVFASAWSFRLSQEVGVTLRFGPGGEYEVLAIASIPEFGPGGVWQPIGDSCLRWGQMNLLADQGSGAGRLYRLSAEDEISEETRLVENVVPLASPVLIWGPSQQLILFCLHDPNKPWFGATDIGTVHQAHGRPWTLGQITDDQAAEFSPSGVVVGSGTTLAAWERISGDISDANEPQQITPHLEIVTALFDPVTGIWSTPQQLTSNDVVDHQPVSIVLGATRGILWIQDEGTAAMGDANSGDRLMFAEWSGNGWDEPQILWSAKKGIVDFAFAADGFGEGHVVLAIDEDGDPNTTTDCELYLLSTAKGAWQTAIQLTSDFNEDALPALVAPDGVPMCVWSAGGTLVYSLLYDWNPRPVYGEYTLANEAPSLDAVTMPGGAAIAYTVQGPNGVDIVASFYDADLDCWSLPRQLTTDEHAETALSLVCDAGELVIAYLKTQTLRTGMDVEIEGQIHHIENVPQPGRTDLYILRHALANDLAVVAESIVLDPANPAPGTAATIRATIENGGDLPLQEAVAVFYDGDPSHGGVPIGERHVIPGTLTAGGRENASVSWSVPSEASSHRLFVVVDPCLVVDDRDRSNNVLSVRTVLPDLAVETCRSTEVASTTMALTARVVNIGVIPAGAFGVSWRLGAADGEEIGTSTIESLIAGGAYEATFIWDTSGHLDGGQHAQVFAVADSAGVVPEFDEANNAYGLAVFHPPVVSPDAP